MYLLQQMKLRDEIITNQKQVLQNAPIEISDKSTNEVLYNRIKNKTKDFLQVFEQLQTSTNNNARSETIDRCQQQQQPSNVGGFQGKSKYSKNGINMNHYSSSYSNNYPLLQPNQLHNYNQNLNLNPAHLHNNSHNNHYNANIGAAATSITSNSNNVNNNNLLNPTSISVAGLSPSE